MIYSVVIDLLNNPLCVIYIKKEINIIFMM